MAAPIGNQNAVKSKPWADAIRRAIARYDAKQKKDGAFLNKLADQLLDDCLNNQRGALEELTTRLDGKPATVIAGDDEKPLHLVSRVELVALSDNSKG